MKLHVISIPGRAGNAGLAMARLSLTDLAAPRKERQLSGASRSTLGEHAFQPHNSSMLDPDAERDQEKAISPLRAPLVALSRIIRSMGRQLLAFLGLILVIIGVPLAMITPFPFVPIGLPVVVTGVALLGRNSVWGHALLERMLTRWPRLERYAPNWLMHLVFARPKRVVEPDPPAKT